MPIPDGKPTQTKKLSEKNAKAIKKQREGVEKAAKLQTEVRDGKKTAAEALKEMCGVAKKEALNPQHAASDSPEWEAYVRKFWGFPPDYPLKGTRYLPNRTEASTEESRRKDEEWVAKLYRKDEPEEKEAPPRGKDEERRSSKSNNKIMGVFRKHFVIWAGTKGWTAEDVLECFQEFGVEPLALSTINVYLEAAEAGEGHRFWVKPPEFTHEQSEQLHGRG